MTGPKEFTLRALFLGAVLSAVMAAANAYLGLFAGMTVSASIPAAVVSMIALRAVRGTILENNLVQTTASAGESVAAGAIFTLPALLMVGVWSDFGYFETLALLLGGGILGTIFTIPLRRILIEETALPFPEGTATANVLIVGHAEHDAANDDAGKKGGLWLGGAALLAFVTKVFEGGLGLLSSQTTQVLSLGGRSWVLGTALSPALFGVGAIVQVRVASFLLLGGLVNWLVVIPFVAEPSGSPVDAAWAAWSAHTRFLGVGAMAAGGVMTLFELRRPIADALSMLTRGDRRKSGVDLGQRSIVLLVLFSLAIVFATSVASLGSALLGVLILAGTLVFAFFFSAVAAYMAGLVGSSNNPVSGVTLATLLIVSGLFVLLRGFLDVPAGVLEGAALLVGAAVCTALAIAGDTIQDLKAGTILGARPRSQQIGQLVGVVAAALVLAPVLELLETAYGFGAPTAAHPNPLRAPQATLMAAVVHGVFGGSLPWSYVLPGALVPVVIHFLNVFLKKAGRPIVPALAVAVGLYLPVELEVAMMLGAIASRLGSRETGSTTTLVGAGLITGEALAGLLMAAFVVLGAKLPWLALGGVAELLGVSVALFSLWLILKSARGAPSN